MREGARAAGANLTIQQVKTTDNRVYDVVTAYHNDNNYNLQITLPDGRFINKDFVSKYDFPDIRSTVMRCTTAIEAKLLFYSDSEGTFHYLLQEAPSALLRAAAQEPAAEAILRDGTLTAKAMRLLGRWQPEDSLSIEIYSRAVAENTVFA